MLIRVWIVSRVFQGEPSIDRLFPRKGLTCCPLSPGPSTSQASYSAIREAVYGERPITKLALNCACPPSLSCPSPKLTPPIRGADRRNGEPFYNLIQIVPIKNLMGEVQFFLGGVSDVTDLLHPFSTKPPTRNGSGKVVSFPCLQSRTALSTDYGFYDKAPDRFYTRILLARPASRKIVYATPEVSTFLGMLSSRPLPSLPDSVLTPEYLQQGSLRQLLSSVSISSTCSPLQPPHLLSYSPQRRWIRKRKKRRKRKKSFRVRRQLLLRLEKEKLGEDL